MPDDLPPLTQRTVFAMIDHVHEVWCSYQRQRRAKGPPRRSPALAGTSDVRSLVVTDRVAHAQGTLGCLFALRSARRHGGSWHSERLVLPRINADLDSPLNLLNFSLSCLPCEYARLAARGEDAGLRQLLPS